MQREMCRALIGPSEKIRHSDWLIGLKRKRKENKTYIEWILLFLKRAAQNPPSLYLARRSPIHIVEYLKS